MPDRDRHVVMTRKVTREWITRVAHAEYRFDVYLGTREYRNLPNLLRSFRDGKVAVGGLPQTPDLGVLETPDKITVWSRDHSGILALQTWFEKRGFETTGVW